MSRKHQEKSSLKGKRSLKPERQRVSGETSSKSDDPWAKASEKVGRRDKRDSSFEQEDHQGRRHKYDKHQKIDYRGGKKGSKPLRRGTSEMCVGIVSAHPDGFGFVDVVGREKGVFLPHEEMRGLMHGDSVEVCVVFKRGRESGEYVRTVEEAASVLTGQFGIHAGIGLVKPRSRKIPQSILVKRNDAKGAVDGDWVRVKVERGSDPLRGHVLEVVGDVLEPSKLVDLVVAELGLDDEFPDAVKKEAEDLPSAVRIKDKKDRLDLTHLPFVTIDGEDAKDFDDAICIISRGDGFEAWVAIADVAHYIQPNSALDVEALERSNSFYFPDRVIPMLPEKLSNGLCSLKSKVNRLAMVVRMRMDGNGKRRSIQVYDALIRSQARLTYTQVAKWLEDANEKAVKSADVRQMLLDAERLFHIQEKRRAARGALDLDMPESRAVIKDQKVASIDVSERNIAHRLIEEMMLAANTAVAEFFERHESAVLYRTHPAPEDDAIMKVNDFLSSFGLHIRQQKKGGSVKSKDVQEVLEKSEGKTYAHVLHRLVLRSLQQAKYSPNNEGHFGLAYNSYCHFTSPIRRYADLTVHRRLKALINKENPDAVQPADNLAAIGLQTSTQERKQQRAEWDTQAMLAALYHSKDVGQSMTAMISGLTKRRVFLELQSTLAEASLDVDSLGGSFVFDEGNHRLVARRGGKMLNLGDKLEVTIDSTDPVRGLINVSLLDR